MSDPRVIVCAGGGGVGKTTTSAALALALAARGERTLLVTIDPARRLAGALGVPVTDALSAVAHPRAQGRLWALMPDPRRSMGTFLDDLFEEAPEAKQRVLANKLYQGLADAAAGVHELVAMNLVARESSRGRFDVVVIDTAPSRHAIDFVTYPGRLAALLGGRSVTWLAGLSQRADASPEAEKPRAVGRVEALLARVTGPHLVRDTAALFGDLALVRERFVSLTRYASSLLLGESVAYALVAAPTAAARDDVRYLAARLDRLGRTPRALILNRADADASPWSRALRDGAGVSPGLRATLDLLEAERVARSTAADALSASLRQALPRTPQIRLPQVEASSPAAIVDALSVALDPHLARLA